MNLKDKVVVVTGGGNGIGRGLCERFAKEGARAVVVADIEFDKAEEVAKSVQGIAIETDVSKEDDIKNVVTETLDKFGQIDLFCSNAGVGGGTGGAEIADEIWQRTWEINTLAHIYAARVVVPVMLERGEGYLLNTASAAGLLTEPRSSVYAVTKHAAVAFAEWLSINYHDKGIRVSCLCPQGVRTRLLLGEDGNDDNFLVAGSISVEEAADVVVKGLEEERFLILPHPEVGDYFRRRSDDHERWLRGMRRLRASID